MERPEKYTLIAAFEELHGELLRFLERRTGDPDQAADLVQDTYLRLAAVAASDRQVANPRAYILRVANNLVIDRLRRDGRMTRHGAAEDDVTALVDPAPIADEYVLAREQLRLLDEALAQLPPKPRRALLLHRVSGWTQAEIAVDLCVSESMVIKYIAQALRHCRDWRADTEDGGKAK